VIDAPGGGGKVPIGPEYVLAHDKQRIIFAITGQSLRVPRMNDAPTPANQGPVLLPQRARWVWKLL